MDSSLKLNPQKLRDLGYAQVYHSICRVLATYSCYKQHKSLSNLNFSTKSQSLTKEWLHLRVVERVSEPQQHVDCAEDMLFDPACVHCPTYERGRLIREENTLSFVITSKLKP